MMVTKSVASTFVTLLLLIFTLTPHAVWAGADKTTICHQTGSGEVTITVANESLLPAHFEHGDYAGACEPDKVCVYPVGEVCVCDQACVPKVASSHASQTGQVNQNEQAKMHDTASVTSCSCMDGSSGGLYDSDGAGHLTPATGGNHNEAKTFREIPGQ